MIGHRIHQLLVALLVITLVSTPALAATPYSLTGQSTIDIPTQTENYEGADLQIDSITLLSMDQPLRITTSVPERESYYLQLRSPDNQVIINWQMVGNATRTINYFGDAGAGTYAATIRDGGDTVALHPVVRAGYDVTVDTPADVAAGDSATVTATVRSLPVEKHSTMQRVELIIGDETVEKHVGMSKQDDGTYAATIDTDDLEKKEYTVYVVVRGDETVADSQELLGVSDTASLTVTEPENESTTENGTELSSTTNQTDGSSDDSSDADSTNDDSSDADSTSDDSSTGDGPSADSSGSQSTDTPSADGSSGSSDAPATEQENVIEPSSGAAEPPGESSSTNDQIPVVQSDSGLNTLALAVLLAAILSALLVVRNRD